MIEDSLTSFMSTSILDSLKPFAERRALLNQFDNLLQYIRSLQGFESFLQCPSESELRSIAEDGAIVVFNVSDIRSDAFLITTDEIRSVHLPLLTSASVEVSARRFFNAINNRNPNHYRRAKHEINSVLEWLWDVAVSPVLEKLGFTRMPPDDGPWPRVWWVGSGLLNILPIHASGYHNCTAPRTALDRVISSYSPTVKSLAYARERAARTVQVVMQDKAILVSMPTTPEQSVLPFVDTEIENVRELLRNTSSIAQSDGNPSQSRSSL